MKIIVTGCAGFIGSSLAQKLLADDHTVIGIDNYHNIENYQIKKNNVIELQKFSKFIFHEADILNQQSLQQIFSKVSHATLVHLAALTGVRESFKHPTDYTHVNVIGTKNMYELAIKYGYEKFIFASSSSVYGNENKVPFVESMSLYPDSPYAKSKKKAESVLKKLYTKHHLPVTILRFFSVYGPKGRPDMAPYIFTQAAYAHKSITQYGDGNSARDFTYVDDVVEAIQKTISQNFTWEIINIGNSHPISLRTLIKTIEKHVGKKITVKLQPRNLHEALITYADISHAKKKLAWSPKVNFEKGIKEFISWYKETPFKN